MYGAIYPFTFGIFINAFSKEYGWSMGVLSAAFSVGAIGQAVVGPVQGYLVDRFGPRLLMMVGVIIMGTAFLLVRFIDSLVMFYLIFGLLIAVSGGPVFTGGSTAVANWFFRRRGFALSILTSAWVAGGAIAAPAGAWMVSHLGWQTAATIFGAVYLLTGLPLCLIMRHKPEPYGYLPDGDTPESKPTHAVSQNSASAATNGQSGEADFTLPQAIRTKTFWMLALAGAGFSMSNSAVMTHQIPLLTHRGFDPQSAANALGLMAFFSAIGRPILGYVGDRLNKPVLLGSFLIIMTAGILVLGFAQSMTAVYLYTVLYGVGFAVFPVTMAVVAECFGRRFFGTIQQSIQAVSTAGFALGPLFVGWYFDATQEYRGSLLVIALVCFGAALLYFFSRKPAVR